MKVLIEKGETLHGESTLYKYRDGYKGFCYLSDIFFNIKKADLIPLYNNSKSIHHFHDLASIAGLFSMNVMGGVHKEIAIGLSYAILNDFKDDMKAISGLPTKDWE